MTTRRRFFQQTSLTLAAASLTPFIGHARTWTPEKPVVPLQMGIAGYSFRYFSIDDSISTL